MAKRRVEGAIPWAGVVAAGLALMPTVWAQTQQHASAIAGYWTTDARWQSTIKSNSKAESFWIGRMWGRIDATGKMRFDADNGCTASGLLQPFMTGSWQGSVSITNCQVSDMNGRYSVSVGGGKPHLTLRFSDNRLAAGHAAYDVYEVVGTFARYDPLGRDAATETNRPALTPTQPVEHSGASSSYRTRLKAAIKPNIAISEAVQVETRVDVEILTSPSGDVQGVRVVRPSGRPTWDAAVVDAARRTRQLPLDNGRIPRSLVLTFAAGTE